MWKLHKVEYEIDFKARKNIEVHTYDLYDFNSNKKSGKNLNW